jgi:hypothetical protein
LNSSEHKKYVESQEYKKERSECSKNKWKNKNYRERVLQRQKETKEKSNKTLSDKWKNDIMFRKKMLSLFQTPELNKKRSERLINKWNKIRGCTLQEAHDDWFIYRKTVYKMSERSYKKYKNIVNPNNLPRGRNQYHLDHKFSVLDGFRNCISPYVMANPMNLQMLSESENISKDYHSAITMEDLFHGVQNHDYSS